MTLYHRLLFMASCPGSPLTDWNPLLKRMEARRSTSNAPGVSGAARPSNLVPGSRHNTATGYRTRHMEQGACSGQCQVRENSSLKPGSRVQGVEVVTPLRGVQEFGDCRVQGHELGTLWHGRTADNHMSNTCSSTIGRRGCCRVGTTVFDAHEAESRNDETCVCVQRRCACHVDEEA